MFRLALPKKKIATIKRRKARRTKQPKTFEDWFNLTGKAVNSWNAQPNPPKVYINGKRIHHGFVGTVSVSAGILLLIGAGLSDDKRIHSLAKKLSPALLGAGTKLMMDDLPDMQDWFNFEDNVVPQPQFQTAHIQPLQFNPATFIPVGQSNEFV